MEVLHKFCCGLDVHKKTVVACCITPEGKETRSFGTMTDDIEKMLGWIKEKGCNIVAMESTGVFWKPIYNLLELENIQTLIVNAKHIKTVPGRKTDVKDAEWIAQLLRHGLIKGSYIPDREQREIRELVRYRNALVQERAREANRIQKVLEGANIKLASVVSDILGASSRAMIEGLIDGIGDPSLLAAKAQGTLKHKREQLEKGLKGVLGDRQRMLLRSQLDHVEFLSTKIQEISRQIEECMRPFDQALDLLDTIPGIGRQTAEKIIVEIGVDMTRFPSAAHLASWAGLSPGNNESAGKRLSGTTRKGNNALRTALVEAATTASRNKSSYLAARYHRIAARRGKKRAAVAVAHSILIAIYHMIKNNVPYQDLGVDHFERNREKRIVTRAVKNMEALGYEVNLIKKNIA